MKGKITILFDRDRGTGIEIRDDLSGTKFFEGQISPENTMAFLSRHAMVDIDFEIRKTERIGKKMLMDKMEFSMPDEYSYSEREEIACFRALAVCPDGWTPDFYFGSQGSFFTKDGHNYARCTIRKWE